MSLNWAQVRVRDERNMGETNASASSEHACATQLVVTSPLAPPSRAHSPPQLPFQPLQPPPAERCSHSSCHSPCASNAASRQPNFCAHELEARETTENVSEVDALPDFYSLEAARRASHGRIDRSGHAILSRRAERRRRRGKCAARDLRAASWRSRALRAARRTGEGSDADGRVGAVHRKNTSLCVCAGGPATERKYSEDIYRGRGRPIIYRGSIYRGRDRTGIAQPRYIERKYIMNAYRIDIDNK